ncbi:cyclase family protein [Mesorhizobium sp. NZP2077]|uniref:cyclase family protein n=1 Tax=Mesorhizobium sp. NZP2077 TaxID=2483404 RepID=UPI0015543DE7|nr:cyclase family protein [Mesorhizobium sp. NZP2077]QKD19636.1 cyclase family protein [Mesorhizobium sp. NZP2077]
MRQFVDLSYVLHDGMTTYPVPWSPPFEMTQLGRHAIEGRESRKIVIGTHCGTHVDAPRHFIPGGTTIDQLALEPFVGPATVVDFTDAKPLQEIGVSDFERRIGGRHIDRLVMRFDWSDHWGTLKFYSEQPFISEDAARWLVRRSVRLLGMDTPQADSPKNGRGSERDSPVHKILLRAGVIKLEYMTNLRALGTDEFELIALPLNIREGDGSPVRCIGIVEDKGLSEIVMTHEELVREFFARHAKSPLPTGKDALTVQYLDHGLIDSFGIVTMIADFESALGVTFSAEDMQSYEFQTIGGLIGILDRLAKPG